MSCDVWYRRRMIITQKGLAQIKMTSNTLFGVPVECPIFSTTDSTNLTISIFGVKLEPVKYGGMAKFSIAFESGNLRQIITGLRVINGLIKPPGARMPKGNKLIDHMYLGLQTRFLLYSLVVEALENSGIPLLNYETATGPLAITENRVKGLDKGNMAERSEL